MAVYRYRVYRYNRDVCFRLFCSMDVGGRDDCSLLSFALRAAACGENISGSCLVCS